MESRGRQEYALGGGRQAAGRRSPASPAKCAMSLKRPQGGLQTQLRRRDKAKKKRPPRPTEPVASKRRRKGEEPSWSAWCFSTCGVMVEMQRQEHRRHPRRPLVSRGPACAAPQRAGPGRVVVDEGCLNVPRTAPAAVVRAVEGQVCSPVTKQPPPRVSVVRLVHLPSQRPVCTPEARALRAIRGETSSPAKP